MEAGASRGHVRNLVHGIDAEAVGGVFGEGRLAEVDRKVSVVVPLPHEGGVEEVIDVAHGIH